MADEKRLAANAFSNVAQLLLGSVLLFALYRYINSALGVAKLGVWSVVIATVSASRLADLGLGAGVTRFVARDKAIGDEKRAAIVIDTAAITLAAAIGLVMPLFYLLVLKALPLFFQADHLTQAVALLPFAMISLWLTIVAGVFQGGLDGCQRMELRAGLLLFGQALLLGLSIWLVPKYGLIGLAWAQIGQGMFLLLVGRIVLRRALPELPWLPRQWNRQVLREMLGYGANLQAATIFMLLFDPLTKALMAGFGGAASAGYFEMANQVALRVRSIIVAANQAVVPHVAGWGNADTAKICRFYRENMRILVFFAVPVMSLLLAAGPLVSWAIVGEYQPGFMLILTALATAWGFNILASPSYFINRGTGHVGVNTLGHAITGVVNMGGGLLLGRYFGANGVLAGYVIALVVGTVWQLKTFSFKYNETAEKQGYREHTWMLGVFLLVLIWAALVIRRPAFGEQEIAAFSFAGLSVLVASAAWFHRYRTEIQSRLQRVCRA